MEKRFTYTNNLGRKKEIRIFEDNIQNGRIFSVIVDVNTNERCSSGYNTREELSIFLKKYNIIY
jgi:hypothetical protein